jgi:hypothetical protein
MSDGVEHRLSISRTDDGSLIFLTSNGRELAFSPDMWLELTRMVSDFNALRTKRICNYVEALPVRTPIHANTPRTHTTLEDLA